MTESSEQKKVEMLIDRLSEKKVISRDEARTMAHKYVCGGGCNWYKTKSKKAGFDRIDLNSKQKKLIEETIKEVFRGLTLERAMIQIHNILCPSQSRACNNRTS